MNSFWLASSRLSCIHHTIFLQCLPFDKLAVRFIQLSHRKLSTSPVPIRRLILNGLEERGHGGLGRPSIILSNLASGRRYSASRKIITHWDELPKDYQDGEGLLFSESPLDRKQVLAIFGKDIDTNSANRLLRVLHGRRVAGTLADPDDSINLSFFERKAQHVAISWLRKNVPVDEILCAGLQAEKELAAMGEEVISDSEKLGLWKPNSGGPTDGLYGKSGLDDIKKAYERKLDEKERLEKERLEEETRQNQINQADEIRQNTGTLEKLRPSSRVVLRRPGENERLKYYLERAKVLPETAPNWSIARRLVPSGLLVLGVVLLSILFTQVYTPPKRLARMFPDLPPAAATYLGLFIANFVIFAAWRHPPLFRLLNKYFITIPGYPIPLSLVGNIFSHQTFSHFALNMGVLYFVGTRLHDEIGRANFLAVYVSCGAVGSFVSLSSWVIRGSFVSSSLGASGAIMGIIATYLWLNPWQPVSIMWIPPPKDWPGIPSWSILALMAIFDVLTLTRWKKKLVVIDHWAHLGGIASGMCAAELLRAQVVAGKKMERQRRRNSTRSIERIRDNR
jgi:rhomboid-like protein